MSIRRRLFSPLLASALLLPLLGAASLPAAAWGNRLTGSGTSATETRQPGEFQAVATRGSIDIVVRQGSPAQVLVQADDNLLSVLETVVESGRHGPTLQVRWKQGQNLSTRSRAVVTVTTPTLTALAGSGSGDFSVGALQTPSLRLALSGSGDAVFDTLTTEDFSISISGSGDVRAQGEAGKLSVSIAGSGDVARSKLRAGDASISISGSGGARLHADRQLKIRIAGSGDVSYTGDAAVESRVAGSGSIRKR